LLGDYLKLCGKTKDIYEFICVYLCASVDICGRKHKFMGLTRIKVYDRNII